MTIAIRPAVDTDVAAMAAVRARVWETEEFWQVRIGRYLTGEHSPQQALAPRAVFVAVAEGEIVGFVAGHRTRRYGCEGELQWIDVAQAHRRHGIAGRMLGAMAAWFVEQGALRVCVNVAAKNAAAHGLYAKFGARPLNEHWLVWQDIRAAATKAEESH